MGEDPRDAASKEFSNSEGFVLPEKLISHSHRQIRSYSHSLKYFSLYSCFFFFLMGGREGNNPVLPQQVTVAFSEGQVKLDNVDPPSYQF